MGDDDREAILARRRQFIAIAIAGGATVGAAAIGAGAYATMVPCLSPPVIDVPRDVGDAGVDAPISIDAGAPSAEAVIPSVDPALPVVVIPTEPPAAEAEPEVRPRPPTEAMPRACLSVVRPHASESAETPPSRLPSVTE
jgi:hypothetical protein